MKFRLPAKTATRNLQSSGREALTVESEMLNLFSKLTIRMKFSVKVNLRIILR